jgi:hypothetical protein
MLNRSARSVAHAAKRIGSPVGSHTTALKVRLTVETMERLKTLATDLGLPPTGAARVLLTATLRDPWLTEIAATPTVYVEPR